MVRDNSVLINRFFTRNTLKELLDEGKSTTYEAVVQRYTGGEESLSNAESISRVYSYLRRHYKNEYYYKNTLLNKLLLGVHNPSTTTVLSEVPVANSKADFILINGKAVVYEIKTALDNLDRLDGQLNDYYKAFSYVAVVASEDKYTETLNHLNDTPTGLYILTEKGTLSERKKPEKYTDMLSSKAMFKILRKKEYDRILREWYEKIPDVSQFEYYRECLSWFQSIPIMNAHKMFTQELKKRFRLDMDDFSRVPYELKFLVYFSNYKKKDYIKLEEFLNS